MYHFFQRIYLPHLKVIPWNALIGKCVWKNGTKHLPRDSQFSYLQISTVCLVSSEHTINLKARHWKRENIVHVLVWAATKGKKWQKLFRQLHYCFSGPEPFSRQLLLVPEVSRKIEMIIIIAWEMTNSYFLPLSICT